MIIKHNSDKIRYTGRWNITQASAISTANGNYFEFAFSGECAVIGFDTTHLKSPFPHIYVSVDGGANVEVTIDRFIRISAEAGEHRVCIIMKSSVENQRRWVAPIEAGVSLLEIEAEAFLDMPEDTRPTIEFIGDSITEGISIDTSYRNYGDERDMVYWDDSTAGYAWLTAKALNFRPVIMGYGCLGTTKGGAGGVPPAAEAYKHYSDGYPMKSHRADYIVINHGANDSKADRNCFQKCYFELLELVRERNPVSAIIALTPFSGRLAKEIKETVDLYNREKNDGIFYIDTTGWISPVPLHPVRNGHRTLSRKLTEIIKNIQGEC